MDGFKEILKNNRFEVNLITAFSFF